MLYLREVMQNATCQMLNRMCLGALGPACILEFCILNFALHAYTLWGFTLDRQPSLQPAS